MTNPNFGDKATWKVVSPPPLCDLLTPEDVPDAVVAELKELIGETVSS